jgi:hypothetical protein
MKRRNPPHVHEYESQHGKRVYYLRRPGHKKVRLRVPEGALPWSPTFMAVYEAALAEIPASPTIGAGRALPGTVNAALVSYYQSPAFTKGLAESTQSNRRAILEQFRNDHGDKRIALIHSTAIQNMLNKRTPAAARNWKKALRGFIDHCLSLKMVTVDPLAGLKLVKLKSKGHHPWESDECEQFEAFYPLGTGARLAYELLLQAGQSRCDVVRMGRQHIRKGMMSMHRQKTDVQFNVEVMPRLQTAIDAMPAGDPGKKHLTFLVTAHGKPFTAAGFGNWFRDVCRAAKLPDPPTVVNILTLLLESERCAIRSWIEICDMTFGKDPRTYDLASRILNEEIEHEAWFIELLAHERDGKTIPSGHFRRGEPGEAPYSKNRGFYNP